MRLGKAAREEIAQVVSSHHTKSERDLIDFLADVLVSLMHPASRPYDHSRYRPSILYAKWHPLPWIEPGDFITPKEIENPMCMTPDVPKVKPPAPTPAPPLPVAGAPKTINSEAATLARKPAGKNSLIVPLSGTGINIPVA